MRPDEIADQLRRAIREGALSPGQGINQDELAKRLGVSRIPLREALRTLAGEGLVIIRPGLGALVTELNRQEIEELYDLRLQLEPPLARRVPEQLRPRDLAALATLVQRMREAGTTDTEEWSGLSYAYQRQLYEYAERPHSLRLVTQVLNLVEPYSRYYAHRLGGQARVHERLDAELDALRQGDGEHLAELVFQAIQETRTGLLPAMAQDGMLTDRFRLI
jgi:DNA-binding GntR family transcriptional regulator